MEKLKNGSYKRSSGFVEIAAFRFDSYTDVTTKISNCLELDVEPGESLALFKMNGSRIINNDLTIHKKKKPWLIGNYLSCIKKSAAQFKLGIATVVDPKQASPCV